MNRIGIDLGGTNVAAGIVNDAGEVLYRYSAKTDTKSERSVVGSLSMAVGSLLQMSGISADDISVGVACPGTVNSVRGIVEYSANLPLCGTDVAGMLSSETGVDVSRIYMANDADAAALGEYRAGAGRGAHDFLMITIGTGVGGGYISDGKILTGRNHSAGELGHTVIVYGGEPCGCGRRGCAEKYCSATALVRLTKAAVAECERRGVKTLMTEIAEADGKFSGRTAFRAADRGDEAGAAVVDEYISYLSCALTNYINIFQPEVLAVGGGVSNEGERLLDPLRNRIYGEMYNKRQPESFYTKICRAELGGNAGVVGAAMLGL